MASATWAPGKTPRSINSRECGCTARKPKKISTWETPGKSLRRTLACPSTSVQKTLKRSARRSTVASVRPCTVVISRTRRLTRAKNRLKAPMIAAAIRIDLRLR